jgi:anti-sigma regulatory factor (Ser/Thr protein kinase)
MRAAPYPVVRLTGARAGGWHTERVGSQGITDHAGGSFHHATLLYAGEDGFLQGTLPFLEEAVTEGEPVLVAVANARIGLLREALGGDAEHVHFADMHVLGANPARIIPAWHRFLEDHSLDGRPVRGIGEPIWAGRTDAELTECQRHESLLNIAFDGGRAWRLLCPYDLDALDEEVIEAAWHSHPYVVREGSERISDAYLRRDEMPGPFDGALPTPSTQPEELALTSEELGRLRWFVSQGATEASLDTGRREDLVLAVNELATNSLRHGGGAGTVRMWRETDTLLCEVRDGGYITEPLVGRTHPVPHKRTGRGLWLVNQLCDLVQIRSSATGSVVRVHMRLA